MCLIRMILYDIHDTQLYFYISNTIRIHHKCEGGIEKIHPKDQGWHHGICQVMTKGDPERQNYLSHPHTHDGFFFLLTTKYLIILGKTLKRLPESPEYAGMQHGDIILTLQYQQGSTYGQRAVDLQLFVFLSFPRGGTGM